VHPMAVRQRPHVGHEAGRSSRSAVVVACRPTEARLHRRRSVGGARRPRSDSRRRLRSARAALRESVSQMKAVPPPCARDSPPRLG